MNPLPPASASQPQSSSGSSAFSEPRRDYYRRPVVQQPNMTNLNPDSLTPVEVARVVCEAGVRKARLRVDELIIKAVYGGCLIGMGSTLASMLTGGSQGLAETNPGLARLVIGVTFPVGLTMILITGNDLFTANVMFMIVSLLERRTTFWDLCRVWFISFWSNLAGVLFYSMVLTHYAGEFDEDPYLSNTRNYVQKHVVELQWHQIFLRGIACNWVVNLAVWLALSGRDLVSKVYGCHTALLVFASMGYDHVVANMYFIPLGIKQGANISVGMYIWKSLIPSLIGNIVGGGFCIALPFWYLNLYRNRGERGEAPGDLSEIGVLPGGSGTLPLPEYEYRKRDQEMREVREAQAKQQESV